jgi:hypothetical protein
MDQVLVAVLMLLILHSLVAAALARLITTGVYIWLWRPISFCLLGLEAVICTVGIVMYVKGDPSGVLGLIFTIILIVLLFRLLSNGRSPRI